MQIINFQLSIINYTDKVLSLILPTYKEAANLPELFAALKTVLSMPHEIIVVDDDSPDLTWKVAEELKLQYSTVRVLRRIGRRGLSSAVTEGFAMATGDVLMVMDADLQHDPELIIKLYNAVTAGADIAVASRYIEGGSVGDWVTGRRLLSKAATWMAKWLPPVHSSDPMSGFFALNRTSYTKIVPHLRPTGFKILLEVLSCLPSSSKLTEVPLHFAFRKHGESKLNWRVEVEFIVQLLRIALKRFLQMFVRRQWLFFMIAILVSLIVLLPRVFAISPFYLRSSTRAAVISSMQATASGYGLPVSHFSIHAVYNDSVLFHKRDLYRGYDSTVCIRVLYADHTIVPCTD